MAYIPHTAADVEEMLRAIGASSMDDLFLDIPGELLLPEPIDLPTLSEFEIERYFDARAGENRPAPAGRCFLGAGAYRHFIPAASHYLISRGEFMTCYTPYQAEVSQGTLQAVFEFQSHICALTNLDVANASMYDGATALAEAITMAVREKRRNLVYIPALLHPAWLEVCQTFLREIDVEIRMLPAVKCATDWRALTESIEPASAVVVATPNCLGGIEDVHAARTLADRADALLIAAVNPTSLAVLLPPGDYGADIAVGEAQPLGLPLNFGGPYAGFFACRKSLIRKMPGRIVGRTVDKEGNEGFVLTLQTREQHIRRDKATSNICTNQGLFALMVTIYLTLLGREGLTEVAETSLARTRQLAERLALESDIHFFDPETPCFHEVVMALPMDAGEFIERMRTEAGILAGYPVMKWFPEYENAERLILINCTEVISPSDIVDYTRAAARICTSSSPAAKVIRQ